MQTLTSHSFPKVALARTSRQTTGRRSIVVFSTAEHSSRRAAIGTLLAGTAAIVTTKAADAKVKNPAQDSIRKPGSSTEASQSAFGMEGIKKRGLKASQRKDLLEAVKAKAQQLAGKVTS